jgi:hypothetical protein
MQPTSPNDYKALLTDVIRKQIVILGPDITLAKARNVPGLTVASDGTVTEITGEPQTITQALIDQFVQLSGLIVKKTMEPLLMYHQNTNASIPIPLQSPLPVTPPVVTPPPPPTPPQQSQVSTPSVNEIDPALQNMVDNQLKMTKNTV